MTACNLQEHANPASPEANCSAIVPRSDNDELIQNLDCNQTALRTTIDTVTDFTSTAVFDADWN